MSQSATSICGNLLASGWSSLESDSDRWWRSFVDANWTLEDASIARGLQQDASEDIGWIDLRSKSTVSSLFRFLFGSVERLLHFSLQAESLILGLGKVSYECVTLI